MQEARQEACTHVRMNKQLHDLSPTPGQEAEKSNDILQTRVVETDLLTSAVGGTYCRGGVCKIGQGAEASGSDREIQAMDDIIFSVQ